MRKGLIVVMAAMMLLLAGFAMAAPIGPKAITQQASSKYSESAGGFNVSAQAGNVTELVINATTSTQTWQGYYGNVIGSIILANSNNKSMIDWDITGVAGQVYASRSPTISDWTSIGCTSGAQIDSEDVYLNATGKADGVNQTFSNSTAHSEFYVGTKKIDAGGCYALNLRNNTAESSDWQEVLLSTAEGIVYTSILTTDKEGFNGSSYDFQMIVGENGRFGNTATTPYYFWIELT